MTSDDVRQAKDVQFKPAGTGVVYTFKCARCETPKLTLGRRKQYVSKYIGRQFVCAECVR